MATYKTEQEDFWAGEFGDSYIERNKDELLSRSNINFFSKIFNATQRVGSLIEFGANIGLNLKAIRALLGNIEMAAVEINKKAVEKLELIPSVDVHACSLLEFKPERQYDISLVKTVLIHIPPEELSTAYRLLYESSRRYICVAEYYNPNPVEIIYRGHSSKLFKRDFAGEMLDMFSDLSLVDYGFVYHRDNNFPQDDISWFLLEKRES